MTWFGVHHAKTHLITYLIMKITYRHRYKQTTEYTAIWVLFPEQFFENKGGVRHIEATKN